MASKNLAKLSDEELDAEAQAIMEARAADDQKHRDDLVAVRQERDRRLGRARAEELRRQLDDLPEEIRAEVIGG